MGSAQTGQVYEIECPLHREEPMLVRERAEGLEVSIRFDGSGGHLDLLPRFMGDRCEFVPRTADLERAGETDLWTTGCPLHPGNTDVHACFIAESHRP